MKYTVMDENLRAKATEFFGEKPMNRITAEQVIEAREWALDEAIRLSLKYGWSVIQAAQNVDMLFCNYLFEKYI